MDKSRTTNGRPKKFKPTRAQRKKLIALQKLFDKVRNKTKAKPGEGIKQEKTVSAERERSDTRNILKGGNIDKKGKSGLLMVVILSISLIICTVVYVLGTRYEIKSTNGYMYKIDHISGKTWVLYGTELIPIKEKDS